MGATVKAAIVAAVTWSANGLAWSMSILTGTRVEGIVVRGLARGDRGPALLPDLVARPGRSTRQHVYNRADALRVVAAVHGQRFASVVKCRAFVEGVMGVKLTAAEAQRAERISAWQSGAAGATDPDTRSGKSAGAPGKAATGRSAADKALGVRKTTRKPAARPAAPAAPIVDAPIVDMS